jgi:hypothetical protein
MAQTEDIAEVILGEAGKKEQQENEERPLVVQQKIEARHGLRVDQPVDRGPTEDPRKLEGDDGAERQPDRVQQDPEVWAVKVPPRNPRPPPGWAPRSPGRLGGG